jgi:hypothetical protein
LHSFKYTIHKESSTTHIIAFQHFLFCTPDALLFISDTYKPFVASVAEVFARRLAHVYRPKREKMEIATGISFVETLELLQWAVGALLFLAAVIL